MNRLLLCAIGLTTGTYALPASLRSEYAVKERHPVPQRWVNMGPASKSEMVNLQIGLRQSNEGMVEQHLLEISDPKHARYGQHLTSDEIIDIIAPKKESADLVAAWLAEHDITNIGISPAKDWLAVAIPIDKAERLLQTTYSRYKHWDGTVFSRAPEWSLPLHLHEHIDVVQPTTSFFRTKEDTVKPLMDWPMKPYDSWHGYPTGPNANTLEKICNISFTTPKCLRTLYGTIDYEPQAPDQNRIGICNYLNETNKRSDVAAFLKHFRPAAAAAAHNFEIVNIANAQNDQGPYTAAQIAEFHNIEGDLDAELVLSIAWPTPMTAFSTGGMPPFMPDLYTPTDTNEPYLTFLNYILGQSDLPQVISTSYGDDEQTVPESYAKRVCSGYAQLGARGISVLFSSGDSGVGANGTCFSNDGKHTPMFVPEFPTSCPWVTSVGGTKGFLPEVAVSRFGSGAGFSNYFGQPSYQASVVDAYIASLNGMYDGLYNKGGRAYPDVAAQGNHDAIVWGGNITTVGGTSASSPTFAAVIALVNDALIAAGKPPLGFLNPWIYGGAYKALDDITMGSSIGCNGTGFPAQAGWDAVTGFGTPNFGKLVEAAFEKYGGWSGAS